MKIVIPARILTTGTHKQELRHIVDEFYDDLPSKEEFVTRIHDAEIITSNYYIPITAEMIDAAPNLKYIIVPSVGYQSIDTAYAAQKGVKVLNCPTHNSQAVVEHTMTL